jgi:hypothetical protein
LLLLPIGVVFCTLGHKVVLDSASSVAAAWAVTLLIAVMTAYVFCCTVSYVRERNGFIEIGRSLDRLQISQEAILKSRVVALGPGRWIGVAVSVNGRSLPILLHCVVFDQSSVGGFRTTVFAFRKVFSR